MFRPAYLYLNRRDLHERLNFAPMSTVLTTRDPIRVAEEWALLDQLTKGRVAGICVARGYQKRWVQILGQKNRLTAAVARLRAFETPVQRFRRKLTGEER